MPTHKSPSAPSTPPIPPIANHELREAVFALTRAADYYRSAFFGLMERLIAADGVDNEHVQYVLQKVEDQLHLSDAVINARRQHLGHDDEDERPKGRA